MILPNDKRNAALRLDEKTHVEEPLLRQLADLGWLRSNGGVLEIDF